MQTTGAFVSKELLREEQILKLPNHDIACAIQIGEMAKSFGVIRDLPIAVEVRLGDWTIYHASLPGSTAENQWWIDRKARVVLLKHHTTM